MNVKVKCMLCGEEFDKITYSHLRYVHNTTFDKYYGMFLGAELTSKEVRQSISESLQGHVVSREAMQAMSESHIGSTLTEETKQAIRESQIGKQYALDTTRSEETKRAISKSMMNNQNALGNQSALGNTFAHSEDTKREIRQSLKELWRDPEFAHYMSEAQHRRPNGPELQLQSILNKHFPNEWKYTGDGTLWVEGRNPDFINVNGKKQIIEVFGYYWHDPILFPKRPTEEELIEHYRKYGLDCIVFWEYDVYNEEEVKEVLDSMRRTQT